MLQENKIDVKIVGVNGQLSIGKEYAGQQVQLLKQNDGTLIIKKGKFIPDNEMWLYKDDNLTKLERAVKSAKKQKRLNNFEELAQKLERVINND